MAEERRIYVRIALFTAAAAAVYWFVSYERAGTALLVFVTGAAAGLAVMLGRVATEPDVSLLRKLLDLGTFEEAPETARAKHDRPVDPAERASNEPDVSPLVLAEAPFPALSLQPLLLAIGAGAITTGLVFGAWLWVPGGVVVVAAGWRWLVELGPRS
ncbi:MAG TPA: cytochrome c oxidase subunit 4 [Actinomycetota bacterium]|nr:cytochrome c oxidase subunit 4 [Actinomycetota bacterium]